MRARVTHPAGILCVCARAGAGVGQHRLKLVMAQGKSDSLGGHQLKFLCLGNNTGVFQTTRNMSGIPKKLVGLAKKPQTTTF